MKNYEKKDIFNKFANWQYPTGIKSTIPGSVHDYTTAQARKLNIFKNTTQTHRRNG